MEDIHPCDRRVFSANARLYLKVFHGEENTLNFNTASRNISGRRYPYFTIYLKKSFLKKRSKFEAKCV